MGNYHSRNVTRKCLKSLVMYWMWNVLSSWHNYLEEKEFKKKLYFKMVIIDENKTKIGSSVRFTRRNFKYIGVERDRSTSVLPAMLLADRYVRDKLRLRFIFTYCVIHDVCTVVPSPFPDQASLEIRLAYVRPVECYLTQYFPACYVFWLRVAPQNIILSPKHQNTTATHI